MGLLKPSEYRLMLSRARAEKGLWSQESSLRSVIVVRLTICGQSSAVEKSD